MKHNHKRNIKISIILIIGLVITLYAPGVAFSTGVEHGKMGIPQPVAVHKTTQCRNITEEVDDGQSVFKEGTLRDLRTAKEKKAARKAEKSNPAFSAKGAISITDSQAAVVTYVTDTMVAQLNATFDNTSGTQAQIDTLSANVTTTLKSMYGIGDIVTRVSFHLDTSKLPSTTMTSSDMLYYVEQAISKSPRLCCLFTLTNVTITASDTLLEVFSPIDADRFAETTYQYEHELTELLKVPRNNTNMSTIDRFLYLHDEVATATEYSYRVGSFAVDYTPVGTLLNSLSVCQSYAAVFNHAALALGLNSYVVDSDAHAWNAVGLDDAWYYIDVTHDDSGVSGADSVSHRFFLTGADSTRALNSDYASHFTTLTSSLGTKYDAGYYPKSESVTSPMGYTGGYWYFVKNNQLYRWDGTSATANYYTSIPTATSRRSAVVDGILYFGGSDGIYQCNSGVSSYSLIDNGSYSGMYESLNRLYVKTSGSYYIFQNGSTPFTTPTPKPSGSVSPAQTATPDPSASAAVSATPSATPTASSMNNIPTAPPYFTATPDPSASPMITSSPSPTSTASAKPTATPVPTVKKPGKTKITKLKNIKTRTAYVKWKKVSGTSRYRIQYSTSKYFTTGSARDVLTNSVKIGNLFKKKTYYFRVRAVKIKRISGVIRYGYGKWSKVKSVRIKQ